MQSDVKRFRTPRSIAKFLDDIWAEQPVGWAHILAVDIDDKRKPYWLRSDNALHLRRIVDGHKYCDLYFTPHTFSEPERKRKYALRTRLVHADVPAHATDTFGLTDAWPEPWRIWQVGDHYEALWIAPKGATLDSIEALCNGMGVGDDWRHKVTRLLKCPAWELDADDLIRKYRAPVRKYMGAVTQGRRSDVMWKIAIECLQRGMNMEEAEVVLRASGAFKSKHEERGDRWAKQELARLVSKGLNYLHPGIRRAS